jgi:hypothetical protein
MGKVKHANSRRPKKSTAKPAAPRKDDAWFESEKFAQAVTRHFRRAVKAALKTAPKAVVRPKRAEAR